MTQYRIRIEGVALAVIAITAAIAMIAAGATDVDRPAAEAAVLARMAEIQQAAEGLDVDKVFSYVADNDQGALIQNGRFFLTRQDALEVTKRGFEDLKKVAYQFDQQHVTMLSPSVALVTGEGTTTIETKDGQTRSRRFAQSVVLVLRDGQWKVLHAHRSHAG